eukprot:NODE_5205_length_1798_cov_3.861161.p1 GENE.NODE_5205_length_1798_cov_3.861161~~NODE_5205_length_1798_cov_3.861161.p1  ORF type:complete len:486 (+),score=114.18 NODE_5205_length_1798_cov_3.861161:36-1460(+)
MGDARPWIIAFSFMLLGFAGPGIQLPTLRCELLYPSRTALVMSALTALFDASSLVFLIFNLLLRWFDVTLAPLFVGYAVLIVICLITGQVFFPDLDIELEAVQARLLELINAENSADGDNIEAAADMLEAASPRSCNGAIPRRSRRPSMRSVDANLAQLAEGTKKSRISTRSVHDAKLAALDVRIAELAHAKVRRSRRQPSTWSKAADDDTDTEAVSPPHQEISRDAATGDEATPVGAKLAEEGDARDNEATPMGAIQKEEGPEETRERLKEERSKSAMLARAHSSTSNFTESLYSKRFIYMATFCALSVLRLNFIVLSLNTQLEENFGTETGEQLSLIFSAVLPFGALSAPVNGWLLGEHLTWSYRVALGLSIVYGICIAQTWAPAVILSFVVFSVSRQLTFTIVFTLASVYFGHGHLGKLIGMVNLTVFSVGLLQFPIAALVGTAVLPTWQVANYVMVALALPMLLSNGGLS